MQWPAYTRLTGPKPGATVADVRLLVPDLPDDVGAVRLKIAAEGGEEVFGVPIAAADRPSRSTTANLLA
jgi:hypothetical protein